MKRIADDVVLLFLLVGVTVGTPAMALEFPGNSDLTLSDADQVVTVEADSNGTKRYTLHTELFDRKLQAVAVYAKEYPPKFSDAIERERTIEVVQFLSTVVENLKEAFESDAALARRAGLLYTMAFNLDLQEAFVSDAPPSLETTRAAHYYNIALQRAPDDAETHWTFGVFLSSIHSAASREKAVSHLERAVELGSIPALYSLALVYATSDGEQRQRAIELMERYVAQAPDDETASKLLKAVKEGRIRPVSGHFDREGKPVQGGGSYPGGHSQEKEEAVR